MRRNRLLARFGIVSLLPMVILGLVLGRSFQGRIERRTLEIYTAETEAVLSMLMRSLFTASDFEKGLPPERVALVNSLAEKMSTADKDKLEFSIVNPAGRVIMSRHPAEIGSTVAVSPPLKAALAGVAQSRLIGEPVALSSGRGRIIQLFQPVRITDGGPVLAALEVTAPDTRVTATIAKDVRSLQLILALGLAVLWAALLPIASRVSRQFRRQADENAHLALHDILTGLPNRNLFRDRLAQAVAGAARSGRSVGLLLLDLNRFKEVNDSLGHQNGDALLQELAAVLAGVLRCTDTVARLGGDEFAIVVPDVADEEAVAAVATKLAQALDAPITIDGVSVVAEASIGIVVYPDHGDDIDLLIRRADVAMYAAKEGGFDYVVYSPDIDVHSPSRLALAAELRQALATDTGLLLHYQPLARARIKGVRGMEALVRWQHPTRGLVPPADFIPLAEHSGLIRPLTTRVLDLAIADARAWLDMGLDLTVSVNLSARNLRQSELAEQVGLLLQQHGLPPSRLELEITETALLADPQAALQLVGRLRSLGVRIALDDFGTGYSSLAYLKNLPADQIKIDRTFVTNMTAQETDAKIVRSVIALAHNLGMEVTAEGVETADQWDTLVRLDCDLLQGYHLARPLPSEQVPDWLGRYLSEDAHHGGEFGVRQASGAQLVGPSPRA